MMSFYLCIILNTIPLQTDVWLTTALHELDIDHLVIVLSIDNHHWNKNILHFPHHH